MTSNGYAANGTISFTLNFAPATGTNLTVVNNTGLSFISGTFSNLAQGQSVALSYAGVTYQFVATYYGSTGNDLVLQWASVRPLAWGDNSDGQLGNNSTTNSYVPVAVTTSGVLAGKTVVAVASGGDHSVALCSDGTVAAWGYNSHGQLGNNSTNNSSVPVAVNASAGSALSGKTVVAVAVGFAHSVALCADGTVAAWGYNGDGQLGNNSTNNSSVPVAVSTSGVLSGRTVVVVAAGDSHSVALCADGTVAAWGYNGDGELGNNSTNNSSVPVAVNASAGSALSGKTVVAVAVGFAHSVALCADGTVAAWGYNGDGQLGNNSTNNSSVPVAVNASTGSALSGRAVVAAAAGLTHSVALCADGTVAAWGNNDIGQLGNNSTNNSSVPVAVSTSGVLSGRTVVAVAAGQYHSVALCADGTVAAWGYNGNGELGNNSTTQSSSPVAVNTSTLAAGERFIKAGIGPSASHTLALVAIPPAAPTVTTPTSASITTTTAILGGDVTSDGGSAITERGVVYSIITTNNEPLIGGTGVTKVTTSGTTGVFTLSVTSLSQGTGYSFKAYATNGAGTSYTNGSTFTTLSPPTVTTPTSASITTTTATLGGNVISSGDTAITARGVVYAKTAENANPTLGGANVTVVTDAASTTGVFTEAIAGLAANTGYSFAAFATNSAGTAYSTPVSNFSTAVGSITATFNAAADAPVMLSTVTVGGGSTATLALGFAPTTGTNLTVVKNTGLEFIGGTFTNLAQGQSVTLSYGGVTYHFVANYFGGTGNDLVLQWASVFPSDWGYNSNGQLGNNSTSNTSVPVAVSTSGVLSGRTVVAVAAGAYHSMALCSDGTVAAWGDNFYGQLGNSTTNSYIPVAVNTSGVLSGKTVVAVAAGGDHSVALCSDGTVAAWGYNSHGQLGNNSTTQSTLPVAVNTSGVLSGKTVVAVAAGLYHSMALCSDGTVAAWGYNVFGQLGNSSTTDSSVPAAVSTSGVLSGKTVVAVAAGLAHSVALCSDGTVAAWGNNNSGQLGNNSTANSSVPVAVSTSGVLSGKTVVAVAAGVNHSMALCSDSTIVAWGYNFYGQLGNNSTTQSNVPVTVSTSGVLSGKTVVAVAAGQHHSMALCSDSTMVAWGYNFYGQLGNNSTTQSSVPVAVATSTLAAGERFTKASSGPTAQHTLALVAVPPLAPTVTTPTSSSVTASSATLGGNVISGGDAAITTRGVVYAKTAENANPTLGGASVTVVTDAASTTGVFTEAITGLAANTDYSFAAFATNNAGTAYSTPVSTFKTVIGSVTATFNAMTDVPVTSPTVTIIAGATATLTLGYAPVTGTELTVVKNSGLGFISGRFSNVGQGQSVALSYGGVTYRFVANYYGGTGNDLVLQWASVRPVAWGYNFNGQLGNNSTAQSSVPVAVNTSGVLSGRTVVAVAAGQAQGVALCSDGTVAAWGSNAVGQLGNNSTTQSMVPVAVTTSGVLASKTVVAVAAGAYHSVALCSDGTVAAWGDNTRGQLGNNSTANSSVPVAVNTSGVLSGRTVVGVAAGLYHSVALCSDGTVAAWGFNNVGQLGNTSTTDSSVPAAIYTSGYLSGKTVVAVAAGAYHSMALCSDSTMVAWGNNSNGQLGNNSTAISSVPVAVSTSGVLSGRTVVAVAAGYAHSIALCSDGTVAAWGENINGQLGNNSTTDSSVPVAVNTSTLATGERFSKAGSGPTALHTLALVAASPSTVTTPTSANVNASTAILGGNVTSNGGAAITERGVVYALTSVNSDPLFGGTGVARMTASGTNGIFTTGVSGLADGTAYTFKAYANNSAGTSYTSAATFTTLTTLQSWRQQYFGTTANSGNAANNADPYHTGVPNLAVFAVLGPNQDPAKVASGLLPQPQRSGGNLLFSFAEPNGVSGVTYGAEWCADLPSGIWTPIAETGTGTTHTFSVPIADNVKMFIRLRVSSP